MIASIQVVLTPAGRYDSREPVHRAHLPINLNDIRERFEDTSLFFIAENNSQIVGMLRAIENSNVNLFVHENFHKQGTGKRLIHISQFCDMRQALVNTDLNAPHIR